MLTGDDLVHPTVWCVAQKTSWVQTVGRRFLPGFGILTCERQQSPCPNLRTAALLRERTRTCDRAQRGESQQDASHTHSRVIPPPVLYVGRSNAAALTCHPR